MVIKLGKVTELSYITRLVDRGLLRDILHGARIRTTFRQHHVRYLFVWGIFPANLMAEL